MCGLIGGYGPLTLDMRKALWTLLRIDHIRGAHSTGVALSNGQQSTLLKEVGDPWAWLETYGEVMPDGLCPPDTTLYMGHNRYATVGAKTIDNAHPFISKNDKLIGCHNGTIKDPCLHHFQKVVNQKPGDYDTDSEGIINAMSEYQLKDCYKALDGAWCFAIYDQDKDELMLLRNDQRPMYVAEMENGAFLYSSLRWVLELVCDVHNLKPAAIFDLPTDTPHYFNKEGMFAGDRLYSRFQRTPEEQEVFIAQQEENKRLREANAKKLQQGQNGRRSYRKLGKKKSHQEYVKAGEAYNEYRDQMIGFTIDPDRSNDTTIWGHDVFSDHSVRFSTNGVNPLIDTYMVDNAGFEWYIAMVGWASVDEKSKSGVALTVHFPTVSEPQSWTYLPQDQAELKEYLERNLFTGIGKGQLEDFCKEEYKINGPRDEVARWSSFPKLSNMAGNENLYTVCGTNMSHQGLTSLVSKGCCNCGVIPQMEDIETVNILNVVTDTFLCEDCNSLEVFNHLGALN